jgi:hypothetical protein
MNQREQSLCYLRQYLRARKVAPWIVHQHASIEDRVRCSLQDLDGMAGDWYTSRYYTTHYTLKVDSK